MLAMHGLLLCHADYAISRSWENLLVFSQIFRRRQGARIAGDFNGSLHHGYRLASLLWTHEKKLICCPEPQSSSRRALLLGGRERSNCFIAEKISCPTMPQSD